MDGFFEGFTNGKLDGFSVRLFYVKGTWKGLQQSKIEKWRNYI